MTVTVYEKRDFPGEWAVEALDSDGDGGIDVVIFGGPASEQRAREYANWKYGEQCAWAA